MDQATYEREKALFLYIAGLERGDFDQMSRILEQAQTDPVLEKMIEEAHEVYIEEMPPMSEEDSVKVRGMIERVLNEQRGK